MLSGKTEHFLLSKNRVTYLKGSIFLIDTLALTFLHMVYKNNIHMGLVFETF